MEGEVEGARVAVLGAGAIAQVVHLPILTRMRGVDVVGVCDSDGSKAASVAQRFAIPQVYPDPDSLWDDAAVDAVVVCTPSNLHEEQIQGGLGAGKYVLCEKPLALTAAGAERVLDIAEGTGRLMIGMNQRFRPDSLALKEAIDEGTLGDVYYLRAGWLNRRAGRSQQHWRQLKERAGGGAMMDLGIQMLDLALWMLGYPVPQRISSHLNFPSPDGVEDSAFAMLGLEDGRSINIETTWTLVADRDRQYVQAIGTTGSGSFPPLKVFRESEEGLFDESPQLDQLRENPFTASYRQELVHFLQAVRGKETIETPTEHLTLMRTIEAIYQSAEEGKEITL